MLVGVVGKPNCGKSTFFKASTLSDIEIANYPFATIDPNEGVAFVKVACADTFFDTTCDPRTGRCIDGKRFVAIKMIDVAGLVPGAHEGKGMGLSFLDDLNQADVLIHVIDLSGGTNGKGEPVKKGTYDPGKDITFLETELDQWYLSILEKTWEKFSRSVDQTKKDKADALHEQFTGLGATEGIVKDVLDETGLVEKGLMKWSDDEKLAFCSSLRSYTKPMVIAANKADVPGALDTLERLREEFPEYSIIPMSAASELALREAEKKDKISYLPGDSSFTIEKDLSDEQKKGLHFVQETVIDELEGTGVQTVIDTAVKEELGLIPIFPGGANKLEDKDGNTLPDCFLMPKGSTVLDFAYRIHSDLGENFVTAIDVKKKQNVKKDHELSAGDVIEIKANV